MWRWSAAAARLARRPAAPAARALQKARIFRRAGYDYFESKPPMGANVPIWVRRRGAVMAGSVVAVGVYYYTSHLETVPLSGRRRFMDCSPATEELMSRQAYAELLHQYHGRILPETHPYSQLVQRVAQKLITAAGMTDLDWQFHVIDSPEANAFVLPGGKVFVYTGILPIAHDEQGLATILGHEVAHQFARHSAERLSVMRIVLLAQLLLSVVVDTSLLMNRLLLQFGFLMPFSRKCESEADHIGLLLMSQACYDPDAAVQVWRRMAQAKQTRRQPPEYLSTHPSHEARISQIQTWLPEARRRRDASDCHEQLFGFLHAPWSRW